MPAPALCAQVPPDPTDAVELPSWLVHEVAKLRRLAVEKAFNMYQVERATSPVISPRPRRELAVSSP